MPGLSRPHQLHFKSAKYFLIFDSINLERSDLPWVCNRNDRLCFCPCRWSSLCFSWENKNFPLSLMFLKNARNVDEGSHLLSPTSHRCTQLKSMTSCFLWRALADAFAAQNGLNQSLMSAADNGETGSTLLLSWFHVLYLALRRTFVVLTDRMRVDVPKGRPLITVHVLR